MFFGLCFFRFGCTKVIISDQGREFVNKINKTLFKKLKTKHRICTAYHPQTNGLVERFNQTLQRSLVKLVNKEQNNWDEYIDGVLFAYRTSVQKSTRFTPFEIMYCRYYYAALFVLWSFGYYYCHIIIGNLSYQLNQSYFPAILVVEVMKSVMLTNTVRACYT